MTDFGYSSVDKVCDENVSSELLQRAWCTQDLQVLNFVDSPCFVFLDTHATNLQNIPLKTPVVCFWSNQATTREFGRFLSPDKVKLMLESKKNDALVQRRSFHHELQRSVIGMRLRRKVWLDTSSLVTLFEKREEVSFTKHMHADALPIRVKVHDHEQIAMFVRLEGYAHPDTARAAALNRSSNIHNLLFDRQGDLLYCNESAHQDRPDIKSIFDVFSSGTYDDSTNADRLCSDAMTAVFEQESKHRDVIKLDTSYVRLDLKPITDPVTNQIAVLMSATDVTAETSAERLLKRWKKDLEQQNEKLLQDKAALTEALVSKYTPDVKIDTQTPVEQTVHLLSALLKGKMPSALEISDLCQVLLMTEDLRQPIQFQQQLRRDEYLDHQSEMSIFNLLGRVPASEKEVVICQNNVNKHQIELTPEQSHFLDAAIHVWSFDAFTLSVSVKNPLSSMVNYLINKNGLITRLNIQADALWHFLLRIEQGYINNPYHNKFHVASVVHCVHMLISTTDIKNDMDDLDQLACYIAAAVHDYRHPGVNNDFLVCVGDRLALTYNDQSVLENFHVAQAFEEMRDISCNFISHMSKNSQKTFRQSVIDQVLCTDMKSHFSVISRFNLHFNSIPASLSATHVSILSQLVLKCADVGHTTYSWNLHEKWCNRLTQEMLQQGDMERKHNLNVSPGMDRRCLSDQSKSQVGFFDIVVIPMMKALVRVYPSCQPILSGATKNRAVWKEKAVVRM